ncbi:hypothetical protein M6D93_01120 [Jatrophihabitans telluris]|uniref:Uncharacterized protein n=1 Tax=Jatrophihabitans telluris TaxID=2038343 RepID=A0ABY4QZT1_9ACTN|nr:hypothetical protein [Jatrophihabitans telluris]UQX88617.1 hypothetical protein M6D93_01120 [Jatrophihabitans telluris]
MPVRTIWKWAATVTVLAVADLLLTIHAHESFRHHANGPSVMSIGQLLGWATTVVLFVIAVLIALGARNAKRRNADRIPPRSRR